MIVATLPEPTVLPPSRSDLAVFRNLFVTVFFRFVTHFMGILPIIFAFSGGSVADSYHDNPLFSVHLCNNIAWAKMNVNGKFI